MFKNLKQQNGFSLISILVVVVIIAALAYGSSFFWSKNTEETKNNLKNTIDTYNQAQQDLSDISQEISEKNELLNETADPSSPAGESGQAGQPASLSQKRGEQATDEGDLLIEGWNIYEKPEMNVRLKYHKDWYYDRDEQAEKDLGYDLYVGFAESPEILDRGRFYPIEFIIVDKDYEFPQYYSGYVKVIAVKDGKQYVLKTEDNLKYSDIIDKMTESFEFLKK